jgi:exodeoxyribonuclease V gamma subunit
VDLYICLPTAAKEYKNELLLSFGSKAAELRNMVERRFNEFELSPEENTGETSLNKLQNQILNNSGEFAFLDDGSVSIDSCFTPAREVECLYNYLLDLFDKDRSLKPGDILVMTTDINKYSPFVKAVFKSGPVRIPYQVSGASNNSEETIVSAIEQILRFTEEDFTSEKVISLLENKRISKRFQISDFNYLPFSRKQGKHTFWPENRLEDDSRYVSWKYGLEKLILGYAMYSDDEFEASDGLTAFPYKDAEAAGSYDLLHLKAFVDKLESVIDNEYKNRTMLEWKDFLFTEVLAEMIFHDDFSKTDRKNYR